jgi:hypothetical protein
MLAGNGGEQIAMVAASPVTGVGFEPTTCGSKVVPASVTLGYRMRFSARLGHSYPSSGAELHVRIRAVSSYGPTVGHTVRRGESTVQRLVVARTVHPGHMG